MSNVYKNQKWAKMGSLELYKMHFDYMSTMFSPETNAPIIFSLDYCNVGDTKPLCACLYCMGKTISEQDKARNKAVYSIISAWGRGVVVLPARINDEDGLVFQVLEIENGKIFQEIYKFNNSKLEKVA